MHNSATNRTLEAGNGRLPSSVLRSGSPPTSAECRRHGADCINRSLIAVCSEQSAVLMGMARGWTGLANQMDRLEEIAKEQESSILIATEF
jgi:hypothetical protein